MSLWLIVCCSIWENIVYCLKLSYMMCVVFDYSMLCIVL